MEKKIQILTVAVVVLIVAVGWLLVRDVMNIDRLTALEEADKRQGLLNELIGVMSMFPFWEEWKGAETYEHCRLLWEAAIDKLEKIKNTK